MKKYTDQLKNLVLKIKNSPKIYISIIAIILLLISIVLAVRGHSTTRGTLEVNARVRGSQFIFNNQVYYAPVIIKNIAPGSYTITVHNTGYVDESKNIFIDSGQTVLVNLKMQTAPLKGRGEDENEQAAQYANQANQEVQQRVLANPLTNYLPQAFGPLMLDYQVDTNGKVQYVVYSLQNESYNKGDYEQQVDAFIQSKGINPASIIIKWE